MKYSTIIFFGVCIMGCEKDPQFPPSGPPTVSSTSSASSITSNSAKSGGVISSNGGLEILDRGICWSRSPNPTINDNKLTNIGGLGSFNTDITGLSQGTTYYVRAYATNSIGTAYGNQISFTTLNTATVTTTSVSNITASTATSGGNISNSGGTTVTARGVCWSTSINPTIALPTKTSNGSGTGSFSSSLTGLSQGVTYYVRAYATNSIGTAYGSQINFTTLSTATVTTTSVSNITTSTAISGGDISNSGGATITARGVCWNTSVNPTIALLTKTSNGSGSGSFSSSITGLTTRTTYYVRAYATNSVGTSYGQNISFTTN